MTKPHFITLTGMNGSPIRVAAAHVIHYGTGINGGKPNTYVDTTSANIDGSDLWVTETPEQIDALLGVTADRVLAAVPKMIAAMEMAREYMSDWTGGKPCLDAIDDALSQATGTTSPASPSDDERTFEARQMLGDIRAQADGME